MRNIFLILIFAPILSLAQKPCGNDIAPNPDSLVGINLGGRMCRFNAPRVDTLLPEFQDPTRLIEWIHQKGYGDCGTGFFIDGQYVEERRWKCLVSNTSKIGHYEVSNPGLVTISGADFYRYLPESINPDKNQTYDASYGDSAPAHCGCLRRIKIEADIVPTKKIEYLYSGKAKSN